MKKIIKYFALAGLGIVALSSCDNDKFLDVPQYDILDITSQFEGDENARLGLNGIYAYNNVSKQDNSWGYKPNLFTGSHPTMDTQCTGWDVKFLNQTWDANVGELGEGWAHAYAAICRANIYLAGLETAEDVSAATKKYCEGEARALRGYFYTWLATTFGRVPMLATGEDFNNTPNKAAAETYEEMWDFIIEDFSKAAELLDWTPYNKQYGRCTKGMAKAYLADAYMWKAFRCPDKAADCYVKAKKELKDIIDQLNPYPCISTWVLFNEGVGQFNTKEIARWTKEYDPTRYVNAASGGNYHYAGDILDSHHYPSPFICVSSRNYVLAIGEFGGLGYAAAGHTWGNSFWSYQNYGSLSQLQKYYEIYTSYLYALKYQGLCAAVYTQLTDVESEINGIMTYDRKKMKMDEDVLFRINQFVINSSSEQIELAEGY